MCCRYGVVTVSLRSRDWRTDRHVGRSPTRRTSALEGSGAGAVVAITRIAFKNVAATIVAYLKFLKLYRNARGEDGFVRGEVALVGPRTLLNVSIWRSRRSMLLWSGNSAHVAAVHRAQRRTREQWSTYWQLAHASESADKWDGRIVWPDAAQVATVDQVE